MEPRKVLWESLKTDSKSVALGKAESVWAAYIEGWKARLAGRDGDAEARFRAARDLAQMRGFSFLTAQQVAERPLQDILARVDAATTSDGSPDIDTAPAVRGGAPEPQLMLSELVARDGDISRHDNRFTSDQQMRLWRNPRKRAVANLIAALGNDRPIVPIGAAEARQHRKWWVSRIAREGQTAETVNKDFNYLSGMLSRFYDDIEHPDPPRPYAGVSIRHRHAKKNRKREVPADGSPSVGWRPAPSMA